MTTLSAKIRKTTGKKVKGLRQKGLLPAVLYGSKIKNENLSVDLKEFEKVFQEAGESTLIDLEIDDKKKYSVLIHDIEYDSLTDKPIHVDFYQPSLTEEIEVKVPIVVEGEAPAVKSLGGTLVKVLSEVEVKALPQSLPKEIKVNVGKLATFEDTVVIGDLKLPQGVKISKDPSEVLLYVAAPEKVEEELEKPIEEKVEEVEKIEKEKKEEAEEEVKEEPKEEKKEAAKEKNG